jgi:hypothetical protein
MVSGHWLRDMADETNQATHSRPNICNASASNRIHRKEVAQLIVRVCFTIPFGSLRKFLCSTWSLYRSMQSRLPKADQHVFVKVRQVNNGDKVGNGCRPMQGEHAHRIWSAIYSQNCFKDVHTATCNEESLVFYRIISGVHASISMHLTKQYLYDEGSNTWGPNMTEFKTRFSPAMGKCSHVQNLYFVYLFVLRAVAKAAPAMRVVHYYTGMAEDDQSTQVRHHPPA